MPKGSHRYFEESENLLRGKSPEDYGPEFAALMKSKLGGRFEGLVSPELNKVGLMSLVGNPSQFYDIAGINFSGNDKDRLINIASETIRPIAQKGDLEKIQEGKRILGIGSGTDIGTYAHELRHEVVNDERKNRVYDLVYGSTSPASYKENLNQVYNYLTNFDFRKQNIPIQEKEKLVLDFIKDEIANERNEAFRFSRPPKEGDFLGENFKLNKEGAIGGFLNNKKLPKSILNDRSKMPFLNFVGRLGSLESEEENKRKAMGGNVERVSYDRKLI
jgi:hypothetical protein